MAKYLDENGLLYFWQKIKNMFVAKDGNKVLSTNDYTTAEKDKLSGIDAGAQVNVIESVKVNGTALTVTGKAVDVTVPTASTTTPKMDGTAAVGTGTTWAKADHVHPTDTSRAPLASPTFTGTPKAPTAASGTNTTQIATTAFVKTAVDDAIAGAALTPSDTAPAMDGTASAGTSNEYARGDHVHPTDTSRAAASHTHGNITNAGAITATGVALANNDALVIVDASDSSNIKKTSIVFDGSTTSQALTKKGTWGTFLTSHQSLANYAPLASPALTGTPTAPTANAGTNTTQIATTAFVKTAVDNAVAGITGIEFRVVESLPTTGENGVIYLVAHSHGTGDAYDEYIWTGSSYEKIGNTDVDLSGYWAKVELVAITNAEIDTICAA